MFTERLKVFLFNVYYAFFRVYAQGVGKKLPKREYG